MNFGAVALITFVNAIHQTVAPFHQSETSVIAVEESRLILAIVVSNIGSENEYKYSKTLLMAIFNILTSSVCIRIPRHFHRGNS